MIKNDIANMFLCKDNAYRIWESDHVVQWVHHDEMYEFGRNVDDTFSLTRIIALRQPSIEEMINGLSSLSLADLEELDAWIGAELNTRCWGD